MQRFYTLALLLVSCVCLDVSAQQPLSPLISSFETYRQLKDQTPFAMEWISLGPVVNSARVEAVQADPTHPGTIYAAFGSGNLWKTTNNGLSWKPIFENQPSLGIGDIALAPSDPDILYVGTGESLKKARNFTMPGTGIYRSDDAGESWRHLGLDDSWHIGEIAVHPNNPDIVLVAVLGHFWTENPHRGLYRSQDGGKSWEHVLFVDAHTGANDVVFSYSNPNILYASMWENYPDVSGANSTVYRSKNGGKSWEKVDKGLPSGSQTGRIGLAVSYSDPNKVYALVDNRKRFRGEQGAAEVYQSLNGGKKWDRTHKEELLIFSTIGWYFADLYVHPQNDEELFALGVRLGHSTDGGKSFGLIGGTVRHLNPSIADGLHLDHCELWIDPLHPQHILLGNDGGLYQSYDKGQSWTHFNNIPAGEFYDISIDQLVPYYIYGGTQDDATVYGPSLEWQPEFPDPWRYLWIDAWQGGDGCMTYVDPEDPNTVYFSMQHGSARRKDMSSGLSVSIRPTLPEGHSGELRFNFVAPYLLSPYNPQTLYKAGNYVFKSIDQGDNWQLISEDISRSSNPEKHSHAAGAMTESPTEPGLLYVGMDKGAFWVSENDGFSWEERSAGLPHAYIRSICASKYHDSRIYMALTGINYDDLGCHLYWSEDRGYTWESIQANLPDEPANVIIEDPVYEDILYAGLYRGVYVSPDRGESWELLGKNLPAVAVADLEIHPSSMDLIVATHGRGIFKVNLRPLHEAFERELPTSGSYVFSLPDIRRPWFNDTHRDPNYRSLQKLPISFWLAEAGEVMIQVVDDSWQEIWSSVFEGQKGLNQYRWDLVIRTEDSPLPYHIHRDHFLEEGSYRLLLMTGADVSEGKFQVLEARAAQGEGRRREDDGRRGKAEDWEERIEKGF